VADAGTITSAERRDQSLLGIRDCCRFSSGVLFNPDYSIYRAAIVLHRIIEPHFRFSRHANGWLFELESERS